MMIASFLLSYGYIFNLKCDKILDTERGKNMNDIFTQQPDIVTAGTDFVISLMAAVFGYMTVRRHTDRNAVCNMSILMFAAVFAAGIAGAVLHGLTAVSESFAAEQVIRSFTAACLGGIAVPVVYICMYCASGRLHAARLGRAALILWVASATAAAVSAAGGNRAFGPVYIYAAVCILFAAGSGIYCVLSGKAREMIFLLICIAAAGAGLAVQNLLAEGKTLNLILQFNHSGLAHIAVIAVLPLTYIWCNRIISRYK